MLLAGDIGGTKTVLAIFTPENGPHQPLHIARYVNRDFSSLHGIIQAYLEKFDARPSMISFGVAGPVKDGRVNVTNLPWTVDSHELRQSTNDIPVFIINDLEALAYSIPTLNDSDLVSIKAGDREAEGSIAVIAPGTGLGEAYLFWDGQRYRPIPSEGGHTDFAPATALELELLAHLHTKMKHVSYERVCSGLGIPNLYNFFLETGKFSEPAWLRQKLAEQTDKTPVIIEAAVSGDAEICVATLNMFTGILGSEAGNLVLQVLATGGVFLGGGIPPRILSTLQGDIFIEAFTRKGRFSDLLIRVPVDVIVNNQAGLFGAANYGFLAANGIW
jgi:glucokinase